MIDVNSKELPKGWCWVQHKDIAKINPKLPFNNIDDSTLVSFVPMSAVEVVSGKYDLSQIRQFGEVKKGYTPFTDGDLIFAKITPCMENGKIAVLDNLTNSVGFGSTEFHVSRLTSLTHRKYLFYFFTQKAFRRNAQQHMTGSAGQLRVPKMYFEQIFIPFPPFSEQHRIVEKIEELFSDLDKGIESLKTTQQQLKIYRQAVLKWAFEGKLTAKWREEKKHKGELKSAEELLDQIKAEREKRDRTQLQEWHEAVKTWEAKGKQGKKPGKPRTANEVEPLSEVEIAKLPELPEGWKWVKTEELGNIQLGRQRSPSNRSKDFPTKYIRAANITESGLNLTDVLDMEFRPEEFERYKLELGDILVSEASGSLEQVGKPALWKNHIQNCCFQNTVIRLKPICVSSEYVLTVFKTFYCTGVFARVASGVGINHLSANKFAAIPVPLASAPEQHQIVQEIEFRLSICDRLETTITENLTRAEALRQSILKQAFEGKLVPQDPNDEPAEKLIERIRQEKRQQTNGKQLELEVFVDVENKLET